MGSVLHGGCLVAIVLATSACTRTWTGSAAQPNPLGAPTETLRTSEEIVIITGDKDLYAPVNPRGEYGQRVTVTANRRWPLVNKAQFVLVTRDRMRVHVQLEHKWQDYVDLHGWRAYLQDDKGRRYVPRDLDRAGSSHEVLMWDYESRTAVRNRYGDIVQVLDDGFRQRRPLGSLSWFKGTGDFVFYDQDIFHKDLKSLTLVLERRGMRFRFVWHFTDEDVGQVASAH